jgi:AcrR family transcriptional regulator
MPKSKERCQEIREEMRATILQKSLLYFARNGFAGTKISDLSKNIGIAQGTIYVYFESKEDLFQEILKMVDFTEELQKIKLLVHIPLLNAKKKLEIYPTPMEFLLNNSYHNKEYDALCKAAF